MESYGFQIALVVVLILINAVFSGSEMALVSLRESQVRRLEDASRSGKVLARLTRDPNRFLATIQIGITLAGFLASAAAAVSLAVPLIGPLSFLGEAAEPVAIIVVTILLTFVTLVAGELAPKRIAMQYAEQWALLVARPLDFLSKMARPVIWLLGRSTNGLVRLTGADPDAGREEITAEEIRDMIATQHGFTPEQRTIISGAFDIAERTLREVLIPRRDVTTLRADLPIEEGMRQLVDSGHTRVPVVGPLGLDDVVGVVHMRDLLRTGGLVGDHVHPPLLLPETLGVSESMRYMRTQRQQFALIVDEYGAIEGIVTMEDLVEEVVGEIYDETDPEVQSVIREPDGALLLPGGFPIHDLVDIGISFEATDDIGYTTVAGLLLYRLGHVPQSPGESIELPGFFVEVAEVTGHAITKVRLRVIDPPE